MVKSPKFRCKKYLKVLDGRFNHVLKFKNEGRWYLYLYNDWNVLNQLQRVQNNEKCFSCNELASMECKLISEYDSEHYFCAVCFVEYKESWLLDAFESEWGTCWKISFNSRLLNICIYYIIVVKLQEVISNGWWIYWIAKKSGSKVWCK